MEAFPVWKIIGNTTNKMLNPLPDIQKAQAAGIRFAKLTSNA
jgi:hypothetical protein